MLKRLKYLYDFVNFTFFLVPESRAIFCNSYDRLFSISKTRYDRFEIVFFHVYRSRSMTAAVHTIAREQSFLKRRKYFKTHANSYRKNTTYYWTEPLRTT